MNTGSNITRITVQNVDRSIAMAVKFNVSEERRTVKNKRESEAVT
jgi:hypothetical protein